MNSRSLLSVLTLVLAAGSGACTAESQQPADADNTVGKSDQSIITATGNIMAWPAGPITWNGLVGTWPISVWSPATIGALAFDVAGVSNLGVSCLGYPNITALPITSAYLTAFGLPAAAPLGFGAPLLGSAGLFAPAYGFTGTYAPFATAGYGFGAFAPFGSFTGTFMNGAFTPGWAGWTPALTSSALMFNNLATINAMTAYTFNVTFTAQSAAQAAALNTSALSIYATPILPTALTAAAIPYTSLAYPIMFPLTTTTLATPALTAPLL